MSLLRNSSVYIILGQTSSLTILARREKANFMDVESALLESEANILKARIRQTK